MTLNKGIRGLISVIVVILGMASSANASTPKDFGESPASFTSTSTLEGTPKDFGE